MMVVVARSTQFASAIVIVYVLVLVIALIIKYPKVNPISQNESNDL